MNPGSLLRRFFVIGCLILLACLQPGLAADDAKGALEKYFNLLGYQGVTFKGTEENELLLDVIIGEKKSVLLVDTGWGFTTLSERAARGLKRLRDLGGTMEDGRLGTLTDPSLAVLEKLVIGKAQFLNQPAVVNALEMDYQSTHFDGVLGCDFYWRNFCMIDCFRRKLFMRPAQLSEQQSKDMAETFRRSGIVEVPIRAKHHLLIDVEINKHPARLLVDTGFEISALDEEQSKTFDLNLYKEKATGSSIPQDYGGKVIGMGSVGAHKVRVVTIKSLQMGSRKLDNVHFGICNFNAWQKAEEREWVGVIGEDLLESQGALLDFAGGKVWFSRKK